MSDNLTPSIKLYVETNPRYNGFLGKFDSLILLILLILNFKEPKKDCIEN